MKNVGLWLKQTSKEKKETKKEKERGRMKMKK